ncbi:MAG: hypothetical protein AB1Z98_19440 [Nannocystaceae bacterium]
MQWLLAVRRQARRLVPSCSRPRRALALVAALTTAVPVAARARPAAAGPDAASPTAPSQAAVEPGLARSRALYDEGRARFDTVDYEGAVELWTKAYAELPEDADGIRNQLVYNIATAQQLAYDVSHDLRHLRQAVLLLEQYIKSYKALHVRNEQTQAEVGKAQARIAQLQERIERAERGDTEATETTEAETTNAEGDGADSPSGSTGQREARYGSGEIDGIVWTTPTTSTLDRDRLHRNRMLATEDRKTDKMLIGSYVALSLGGLATLAGAGTIAGTRSSAQGARGAGYGTLGLGVIGLATGFTLLAIGIERRKRARKGTLVAGAPLLGPGLAGAAMMVRF